MLSAPGVTPTETKAAVVTRSDTAMELTAPRVAVILVEPAEWLVTSPELGSLLLILATAVVLDVQVTARVKS
jgi:hypothetical protein